MVTKINDRISIGDFQPAPPPKEFHFTITATVVVKVEADSMEEAKRIFKEDGFDWENDIIDVPDFELEEVKEAE